MTPRAAMVLACLSLMVSGCDRPSPVEDEATKTPGVALPAPAPRLPDSDRGPETVPTLPAPKPATQAVEPVASSAAPLDLHFRESAVPSSVRSDDGPGWRRPDTLPQLIDSEDLPQQPAIKGWLLLKDDEEHAKRGFDGAGFTIEVELD